MTEINPYAAPHVETRNWETDAGDASLVRQAHLPAETTVRALGCVVLVLGWVVLIVSLLSSGPVLRAAWQGIVVGSLLSSTGYGLLRLRSWAWWLQIVICSILGFYGLSGLAGAFISSKPSFLPGALATCLVQIALLRLLTRAASQELFRPDYATVIRATPHTRLLIPLAVKSILLAITCSVCLFLIVAGVAQP